MKITIGVLGPNTCTPEQYQLGKQVGAWIAKQNAQLVCGGLGGMMRAAAEGAKSEGGTTIGILPGDNKSEANEYIDIALPTGLGPFRNTLVVRACDAVIAIYGAYGTLSEISFALRLGIPVIGLHTWEITNADMRAEIYNADTPEAAARLAMQLAASRTK